jgi:hypothetical protein
MEPSKAQKEEWGARSLKEVRGMVFAMIMDLSHFCIARDGGKNSPSSMRERRMTLESRRIGIKSKMDEIIREVEDGLISIEGEENQDTWISLKEMSRYLFGEVKANFPDGFSAEEPK